MAAQPQDGRALLPLMVLDEYTRECLAIAVGRRLTSEDVLDRLSELFLTRGIPDCLHSDNGSEFTAGVVRTWLARLRVRTLYIAPGSPWKTATSSPSTGSCGTNS